MTKPTLLQTDVEGVEKARVDLRSAAFGLAHRLRRTKFPASSSTTQVTSRCSGTCVMGIARTAGQRIAQSDDPLDSGAGQAVPQFVLAIARIHPDRLCGHGGELGRVEHRGNRDHVHRLVRRVEVDGLRRADDEARAVEGAPDPEVRLEPAHALDASRTSSGGLGPRAEANWRSTAMR